MREEQWGDWSSLNSRHVSLVEKLLQKGRPENEDTRIDKKDSCVLAAGTVKSSLSGGGRSRKTGEKRIPPDGGIGLCGAVYWLSLTSAQLSYPLPLSFTI